jgi:hypothetical protein
MNNSEEELVLVIEDNVVDFNKLTNSIKFDLYPSKYEGYNQIFNNYNYNNVKEFVFQIINENYKIIKAIIIDISLKEDDNKDGLKLVEDIRNGTNECKFDKADLWCKAIPIFCYSRFANNYDIKKEAYLRGVTNIFSKISNKGKESFFLEQNITLYKRNFNYLLYSSNDLIISTDMLLQISEGLAAMRNELTDALSEKLYESVENLFKYIDTKSTFLSEKIGNLSLIVKKTNEDSNEYLKLILLGHLMMLEPEKRDIFYKNCAESLSKLLSEKDESTIGYAEMIDKVNELKRDVNDGFNFVANCISILSYLKQPLSVITSICI